MIKYLILFLTLSLSAITLVSNDILTISEVNFYALIGIILLDYCDKKTLTLFQTWLVGFIFIILSDAILTAPGSKILQAVKFLLIANHLIIIGYLVPMKFRRLQGNYQLIKKVKATRRTYFVLLALLVSYVVYALPGAILSYSLGRNAAAGILWENRNLLLSSIFGGLGYVLPSIIAFYYKEIRKEKSILIPLLLSIPVFIILFIGGSRFPLLFSFGGFIIITQVSSTGRISLNLKIIGFLLLLIVSSYLMGQFRSGGLAGFQSPTGHTNPYTRLSQRIAYYMSPEGTVDQTAMLMAHFENNPHTYGKSVLFLTYFWVPRSLWPDKPTMLGHWLIREYRTGFSEGHSSSFGFTGELFADFGYFSLLFVFLLGILLNWADKFIAYQLAQPMSYPKILVGMILSYVFFFVRSPITATMTFLSILLVYFMIRELLFKKVVINKLD